MFGEGRSLSIDLGRVSGAQEELSRSHLVVALRVETSQSQSWKWRHQNVRRNSIVGERRKWRGSVGVGDCEHKS